MENQFPFAPGIAGIDKGIHILALDESRQKLQPRFSFLDGIQIEVRGNNGQMRETPFSAFDLILFRHRQLKQVADSR